MKYIHLFIITLSFAQLTYSQSYFEDAPYIKTVIFKPAEVNRYAPIIRLGEELFLSFDDLNADEHIYSYKIEHYTYDWKPSALAESEFIDGFAEDRIRNYENSFNTLQPYTYYQVTFPNRNTQIKISGNYILSVINEFDEVVFKRRFVVYQPKVAVAVALYRSRDIATIEKKQAVEFSINHPGVTINNPQREIYPVILQNNNWQQAIYGLKPQFYRSNQLLYKYNKKTGFWGSNEFLFFDTKTIRSTSLNIAKIELGKNLYHTYLYTNEDRNFEPYTYFPDVNGNFYIRTIDTEYTNLEADYTWVHFYLKTPANLENKEVFVNGNFNNWELNNTNKLTFNKETQLYETKILLKQGFYNYSFVTRNNNGKISNYNIDGSHYETENDYTVIVYYNKFAERYYEVIGVGFGSSLKINN